MNMIRLAAALALVCVALLSTSGAEARQRHNTTAAHERCNIDWPCEGVTASPRGERIVKAMGGLGAAKKIYTPRVSDARPPAVAASATLVMLVDHAAAAAGVPAGIAHAVIRQESNYRPEMRGAAGEWGIGQIKCQTAKSVGFGGPCALLADATTNLRYAMAYLRLALDRGGQGCAGVSLYQRGIFGRAACSGYGRQVMARAGR